MNVWELIIQQPLTNVLIVLAHVFGGSFGVAIILLTLLVNFVLLPLTLNQIKSSKKMQDLQPKLAELQKKYAKDSSKLAGEQMRLYREAGVKPAGCAITMIIQMPVWFALYQSVMLALAAAPEGLLNLARYLYPWEIVFNSLPMNPFFLGINLGLSPSAGGGIGAYILTILVGVTMWVQQKMSMTPSADPRAAQQNQMMVWMMPLLFTFMALSFPSGLALYWVVSSLFRIVLQYKVTGWGTLRKKPASTGPEKKYISFDTKENEAEESKPEAQPEAKPVTKSFKPKNEVIITDKNSLKKSQGSSTLGRLFGGKDKNQPKGK